MKDAHSTPSKQTVQGSKKSDSPSKASTQLAVPLVDDDVHRSLSKECAFLHLRVGEVVPPGAADIAVPLPKEMFHYDEDTNAWLSRGDVTEFLKGEMLNISIIKVFMRYFDA